jgi:putative ABC transport system substrate-binding protein
MNPLRRRRFLIATGALLASPLVARAQPAAKPARVGWIALSPGPTALQLEVFGRGMRERGWMEGQNLAIDVRWGDRDRARDLMAELVRLNAQAVVTQGPMVFGARAEAGAIPLVFLFSGDPVEAKLVASLARPGGNLTGLTLLSLELAGKRLELLKEVLPRLSRVAILANQEHPGERAELRESQAAAARLGLTVQYVPVQTLGDFDAAFNAMERERTEAVVAFPDVLMMRQARAIAAFAAKHRIATVSGWADFAVAGNLMTYGPNFDDSFRILAAYVDKILRGARPADLPIEQPTKLELVINLKTAKTLGLTLPQSLLVRADRVI